VIEFKEDININDLNKFQSATWILWTATILFCEVNRLPFKVTSLISDRENVKAKSKTHEQGRAFDLSVKGWTEQDINRFVFLMNRDYSDIAAVSASDLEPRAVVYHDNHLHIQVRPNVNCNKFI